MRYVVQPYIHRADIHPEVYGDFSEHLGRCVCEGVYAGRKFGIAHRERNMRTDIVSALVRRCSCRVPSGWPRRVLCGYVYTGATAWATRPGASI